MMIGYQLLSLFFFQENQDVYNKPFFKETKDSTEEKPREKVKVKDNQIVVISKKVLFENFVLILYTKLSKYI